MDQKSITIDIFGKQGSTVEHQAKIIHDIPHLVINTHTNQADIDFELVSSATDILIINLSDQALSELKNIEKADLHEKPIIVIGNKNDVNLLSVAISAGITEFINQDDYKNALLKVINKVILSKVASYKTTRKRKLNIFVNAKGGSGASFIASNISGILSEDSHSNVVLLDLDLQFGASGLNFNVVPKYSITEVLASIDEIDHLSLEAYIVRYKDLGLLLPASEEIVLPGETNPEAMKTLLYILQRNYNQILIDLPRIIDPLTMAVLELADHITIVVQQSLAQYWDGRRLINILNKDLDIPLDKIIVAINRYDAKSNLKKSDMVSIVNHNNVFTIANDFKKVASASNLGEPLYVSAPKSKITNDLKQLSAFLGGIQPVKKQSVFSSRVKNIFG